MNNSSSTSSSLAPLDRSSWKRVRLGEICSIKARIGWQGLTTSEYLDSGEYCLVSGTDFEDGFVNWKSCSFVSEWRYKQDPNIQLRNGDVLISKDGTIGKVAYVWGMKHPTTLNSGVFVIRPKTSDLLPSYLQLIFKSQIFTDFLAQITAGSTIVHLYQKDIVSFSFPLPPLPVQRRIALSLSAVDGHLASLGELVSKYEAIKKSTVSLLLQPKPSWQKVRLGEVGRIAMCKRILKSQTSESGDVPFFKIGTFGKAPDAFISRELFEDFKRRFSFPKKGDVLLSAAGTIGRTVVFNGEDAYFQDSNIVWIENDEKVVTNKFLHLLYGQVEWQTENGGTVSRLYNANIENTVVSVPPLSEQRRIVTALSSLDGVLSSLAAEREKLASLKRGLLRHFFG
jgi:type I restriction enzyme, S subunit